jgi:hypothetical protein
MFQLGLESEQQVYFPAQFRIPTTCLSEKLGSTARFMLQASFQNLADMLPTGLIHRFPPTLTSCCPLSQHN